MFVKAARLPPPHGTRTEESVMTVRSPVPQSSGPRRDVFAHGSKLRVCVNLRNGRVACLLERVDLELCILLQRLDRNRESLSALRGRLREDLRHPRRGTLQIYQVGFLLRLIRALPVQVLQNRIDPLEADRESARRRILTGELADHLVVAAAPCDGEGIVVDCDLENAIVISKMVPV